MRKMPLLSFFHYHKHIHMSQNVIFQDVCEESLHLHVEYSGNDVWSLVGLLILKNGSFYFRPVRVASEGEEEVWFAFAFDSVAHMGSTCEWPLVLSARNLHSDYCLRHSAVEFHFMGRIMEVDLSKEVHLALFRKGTGNVMIDFLLFSYAWVEARKSNFSNANACHCQ